MYHDVMNPKPSMGYHPNSQDQVQKPINHEIQLSFKYENLLLCVCVCVCVCVRMKYFPCPEQSRAVFIQYNTWIHLTTCHHNDCKHDHHQHRDHSCMQLLQACTHRHVSVLSV